MLPGSPELILLGDSLLNQIDHCVSPPPFLSLHRISQVALLAKFEPKSVIAKLALKSHDKLVKILLVLADNAEH